MYAIETFQLALNDLSSLVQLLQPQFSKEDVMSIPNGAVSLHENWPLCRMASDP